MSTNRIALRSVEQFMTGFTPTYAPLYSLFLNKSQAYEEVVGQLNFKRVNTIGDIRAKHITPKDTEIRQISVNEGSKVFKKYFLANQYQQSDMQDNLAIEDVNSQVLDEHHKQADEIFAQGEGTSNSNMINNSLLFSNDPNYITNSSSTIADLNAFHTDILAKAEVANLVQGKKVIIVYGTTAIAKLDSLYSSVAVPFKTTLQDVLGADYSIVKMPAQITPSGANGYLIVNLDQVKLHYTVLPELKAQGHNEEKMYIWSNFLMGSMMLEVLVSGAIINTPATFS